MRQNSQSHKKADRNLSGRQRKKNKEMRTLLLIGIPMLIAAILLAILYERNQSTDFDQARLIREDSAIYGSPDAPVTIVEFFDPECESCRAAYPTIKEIVDTSNGQVRLVIRYSPRHVNSMQAALAIEAAGEQGRYWDMMDLLINRQTEWGEQRVETPEVFATYAQELGLNMTLFETARQNPAYRAKIERDRQDGEAVGVDGTPTFFVNGQLVEPLSYDRLMEMINAALGS